MMLFPKLPGPRLFRRSLLSLRRRHHKRKASWTLSISSPFLRVIWPVSNETLGLPRIHFYSRLMFAFRWVWRRHSSPMQISPVAPVRLLSRASVLSKRVFYFCRSRLATDSLLSRPISEPTVVFATTLTSWCISAIIAASVSAARLLLQLLCQKYLTQKGSPPTWFVPPSYCLFRE
jgi:hypothetical protein